MAENWMSYFRYIIDTNGVRHKGPIFHRFTRFELVKHGICVRHIPCKNLAILCNESEGLSRYNMGTNWLLSTSWIETSTVFLCFFYRIFKLVNKLPIHLSFQIALQSHSSIPLTHPTSPTTAGLPLLC